MPSARFELTSQVHMVGHKRIGMNVAAKLGSALLQPVQVEVVVIVAEKTRGAIVTALHDVLRLSQQVHARTARHSVMFSSQTVCLFSCKEFDSATLRSRRLRPDHRF